MIILGIGDHISCGSAILKDGVVASAIIDERLIREKMAFGVPRQSIAKVIEEAGIGPDDIDRVAVATTNQHLIDGYVDFKNGWFGLDRGTVKQAIFDVASTLSRFKDSVPGLTRLYYLGRQPFFAKRRQALQRIFRDEFGIAAPVEFVDHHYCHATTAYYGSGFDDALVVTVDGGGDAASSKVYDVTDGKFTLLNEVSSYNSMGVFYSYITQIAGFKAGRHEGKITGLAAHGKPKYVDVLGSLMTHDPETGGFKNVGNVFFTSALKKIGSLLPEGWDRADLAASIQVFTEDMIIRYVKHWLERTGKTDVALAGGLFGNVAVNRRVHEIPQVRNCYVFPGMSDEGMPIGAALSAAYDHRESAPARRQRCCPHVYLGPEFSDQEIASELAQSGFDAERKGDIETEVAKLLAKGAVVARFNGRMEYGPRALGNRSILYQPTDPSVNDWLNTALVRTEFMPFAPSVLTEEAGRCFENLKGAEDTARFMTITFMCTPWMRDKCPGVVHIDGTARPQLVSAEDNPSYHKIIRRYFELTGLPAVINTSFNMHEEPIVHSPADAIRAFKLGHLDYLAIGNYLVRNPAPIERPGKSVSSSKIKSVA